MKRTSQAFSGIAGSFTVKLLIVVASALGGGAIVTSSVVAAFSANAVSSAQSIKTGNISLTMAPSSVVGLTNGFNTQIGPMVPGDVVNRFVDITTAGTLDGASPTVQIAANPSTLLDTSATSGLLVSMATCPTPWVPGVTPSCGGTATTILASTPLSTLKTATALTSFSTTAGSVNYVKVSITLPGSISELVTNGTLPAQSVQNLTSTITWTFAENTRAATTFTS